MLRALQDFLEIQLAPITRDSPDPEQAEHGYRLATAVLLLEMTKADFDVKPEEREAVLEAMNAAFELTRKETEEVVRLAEEASREVTCLHEYTSRLNEALSRSQRGHIIELLWRVAYADGELDKYEDHLVRKVADLLYVPHREFIQAKHRVQAELEA